MSEITTKRAPRDVSKTKIVEGRRYGWDGEDAVWRLLSKHLPEGINPFNGYTPKLPFRHVENKEGKRLLVDQVGVRLTKDGKVKKSCYPSHYDKVAQYAWEIGKQPKKPTEVKREKNKLDSIWRVIKEATKDVTTIQEYLDEAGNPKPEMILAYHVELWKVIHTRPDVIAQFFTKVYERALSDPIGSLKEFQQLTGVPLTVFMQPTGGEGSFVKLNIFQPNSGEGVSIETGQVQEANQTRKADSQVVGEDGSGEAAAMG